MVDVGGQRPKETFSRAKYYISRFLDLIQFLFHLYSFFSHSLCALSKDTFESKSQSSKHLAMFNQARN